MTSTKRVLLVLGVLVVVAAVIVGGWQLGWWMKSYATSRTAQIYRQSYGAQSALAQELQNTRSQLDTVEVQLQAPWTPASERAALRAQAAALTTQACGLAAQLTTVPSTTQPFVSANC